MRLDMLKPPYEGVDAERIAAWAPPGADVEPLHTVRMFVKHNNELAENMRPLAWFFLDPQRSALEVRVREVAVARTCARSGCEYQWGVHQAVFGEAAGFTPAQVAATVHGTPDDEIWDARDRAVLTAVDELIDTQTLSDKAWTQLSEHFTGTQSLELVALIGWYLLNCFTSNATQTPLEAFAARFPEGAR
ncbi:MAG TPA: carboxymuconolactone decarboxylase family protein [Pseudonocardiaceae bacterium]|nr:carboxymuconolactone decarboxylase family protein [Pseudonocardiaceae bacterium]